MGNTVMVREYPDAKQRAAVCSAQGRKENKMYKCKDCQHETDNEDSEDLTCPECGGELDMMARRVGGFESPEPGDIPEQAKKILASAYASCRKQWVKDHPADKENKANKTRCAKIAWAAVENAGYSRAKHDLKLEVRTIPDVEIMEVGTWKGNKYTEKDLDEAVNNFKEGVLEPYINIDHNDKLTDVMRRQLNVMAMGFVSDLKRKGKKLLADFKQVPKLIAELIQAGALKKRSVEWWRQYKHANGKVLNNVLEAVTFHGANGVPAVNTLADVVKIYKAEFSKPEVEGEKDLIDFQDEEVLKVDEMKIDRAEYDRLKANQKTEADNKVMAQLKADKADADKKAADAEAAKLKAEKEATDAKKLVADQNEATLKAEAEGFVDKIVKDKKLLPKYKEMKVAEYMRLKKDDEETLKLFKEQMETADQILNFGAITKDGEAGPIKFESKDSDIKGDPTVRAEEIVQAIMKQDNISWDEANKKAGLAGGDE
jgi:ssDNA-binding Zn-finger/Zn-ribbon topoisomerase 1